MSIFKHLRMAMAACLLAAPAFAAIQEPADAPDAADDARLRALVERIRADMFRPGPPVAGWDEGGADPDAQLRAAGKGFYYLAEKEKSREVAVLTDRPIEALAPAEWRPLASYGSADAPADNAVVQFALLDSHHVMAMRAGSWRRKDVDCIRGISHAVLYERPGAPAAASEAPPPTFIFGVLMLAAEGQVVCSRYTGDREKGWEVRHFLPDGRSIANERPNSLRIVPAEPLDSMLKTED